MSPSELAQLYDAHAAALFAFALSLTRDREVAREILQEVFLQLVRQPAVVPEDPDGARSWLFRLTHHRIIDRGRRSEVRARTLERVQSEPASPFCAQADPDAQAFRTALSRALAILPEDQRAVVHLKLWEQLSFSQIAAVLELSANTAASRYRYALDKLQGQLRTLYEEIR